VKLERDSSRPPHQLFSLCINDVTWRRHHNGLWPALHARSMSDGHAAACMNTNLIFFMSNLLVSKPPFDTPTSSIDLGGFHTIYRTPSNQFAVTWTHSTLSLGTRICIYTCRPTNIILLCLFGYTVWGVTDGSTGGCDTFTGRLRREISGLVDSLTLMGGVLVVILSTFLFPVYKHLCIYQNHFLHVEAFVRVLT
jgi:hypothetical protein